MKGNPVSIYQKVREEIMKERVGFEGQIITAMFKTQMETMRVKEKKGYFKRGILYTVSNYISQYKCSS